MTREELIEMLNILLDNAEIGCADITVIKHVSFDSFKFVLVQTIQALSQEPCRYWQNGKCNGNTEVCDDAISRQAVLEMAYDMSEIDGEHFTEPCMVVDVEDIQNLPSVTQKPIECEDAISREAVLKVIDAWYDNNRDIENIEDLIVLITYMDSVTPSRHKGHWIKGINTYFNTEAYRCSECNYHTVYKHDICPNCKTEMESSDAE